MRRGVTNETKKKREAKCVHYLKEEWEAQRCSDEEKLDLDMQRKKASR
jgi:hypothetical protein